MNVARDVAPTRSHLLSTRKMLRLAQEGRGILDKKREAIIAELVQVTHAASEQQEALQGEMTAAYHALELARLSMGQERLEWTALAVNKSVEVDVRLRSVMGVVLPEVAAQPVLPETPYGLGDTTVALDEAVARFRQVVERIPALTETTGAVWELTRELQKTQRRVNALQHIFIPQYQELVRRIENALEEQEREEIFRIKRLKARRNERAG